MFVSQDVLWIDVRFTFKFINLVILRGRVDLAIILVSSVTIPNPSFSDDDPGIDVQKDTAIFFRARGIRGNTPFCRIESIETWCAELNPVVRIKPVKDRIQGLFGSLWGGKTRDHWPGLAISVYLPGRILF